jgi:hypothetical protein
MAVVGAGIAIVGVPAVASAGIILNCGNVTTLIIGACPGDTGLPVLHFQSTLTGETATVSGFIKSTPGPTVTNLFVEQGLVGQNGVGISAPSGGFDNEINATNFVSIKPDNPNAEFATLAIDSLQGGEMAVICPEPTAISVPAAGCANGVTLTGNPMDPTSVSQTATIPLTPGGVASVTGINNLSTGGAFGDVKVEAFDATVPEPGTLALLFTGVAGLFLVRKRNLI